MTLADPLPSLSDYRRNFGLSLADLAGHLHSTVGRIEAMEAGTSPPTDAEIATLGALYNIGPDALDGAIAATKMARDRPKQRRWRPGQGIVESIEGVN